MEILFAASEAHPFFVSDGPGVMAGRLPVALRGRRAPVRAVLPLYGELEEKWRGKLKFVTSFVVPVGWRNQYCGLFELGWRDVTWYFLDNEYYFKRQGLYGFYDDGERFAFFSRAILEMLRHIDYAPDIIHCNGWQTALAPVYLNLYYRQMDKFAHVRTIFTIHDIRRQYTAGDDILEGTFGIGRKNLHVLEYGGLVNLTKGAIEASDLVNTVSPAYAIELLDPATGCGLDDFLQKKRHKIHGILNGIDLGEYNPVSDPHLPANYGANDFRKGKEICKKALRKELALEDTGAPLMGMVSSFTEDSGFDLVPPVAEKLLAGGVQLAVLGRGAEKYEGFFEELASFRRGSFGFHAGFSTRLEHMVYAGSDMFLMPSQTEPCGFEQMAALRYGAIPVARETGGLRDTVHDDGGEAGNGFTFSAYDSQDMLSACLRAKAARQDDERWTELIRRAMRCDNGWLGSAEKYMRLYRQAMKLW
ncbi:MAG: glycogen synthase [Candidatus Accumulibacter sp.]|nr:glycogen synthase [Accumulibacter sp.]